MLVDPGDLNLCEGYFILLGPYRQRQLDGHEFDQPGLFHRAGHELQTAT
jgi:hypothetical protein